MLKVSIS